MAELRSYFVPMSFVGANSDWETQCLPFAYKFGASGGLSSSLRSRGHSINRAASRQRRDTWKRVVRNRSSLELAAILALATANRRSSSAESMSLWRDGAFQ